MSTKIHATPVVGWMDRGSCERIVRERTTKYVNGGAITPITRKVVR